MTEFNKKSRKKNAVLMSSMGVLNQIVSNLAAFIYRTVFIYWLSVEYLGINGLFSSGRTGNRKRHYVSDV